MISSSKMSDSEDILASLGIAVGVGSHPNHPPSTVDAPHLSGVTITFLILSAFPWTLLAYLAFRFRRFLSAYIRDRLEYALSDRTDLSFELEYRMRVGGEHRSAITMTSGSPMICLQEEMCVEPPHADVAEEELSEVLVD